MLGEVPIIEELRNMSSSLIPYNNLKQGIRILLSYKLWYAFETSTTINKYLEVYLRIDLIVENIN